LKDVPAPAIHAPWESGFHSDGYPPKPLVDHALARERVLAAYAHAKESYDPT